MKKRPILFSAPMVRTILEGTKTQTRRALKFAPLDNEALVCGLYNPTVIDRQGDQQPGAEVFGAYTLDGEWALKCPYGSLGDELWVKETICLVPDQPADDGMGPVVSFYQADGSWTVADAWPWKRRVLSSIHCPRGLSRITLEITAVRVERLQDISEADCIAEGAPGGHRTIPGYAYSATPKEHYQYIWDSINGAGAWDANSWVWCIEFQRLP